MATSKKKPTAEGRALVAAANAANAARRDPFYDAADSMGEFCSFVAGGGHMAGFCAVSGLKYQTLSDWIYKDAARSGLYARAREERADFLADEIVSIADEKTVQVTYEGEEATLALDSTAVARNRLRVDARKWAASKLKPRVYGERIEQVLSGSVEVTQPIEKVKAELAAMLKHAQ